MKSLIILHHGRHVNDCRMAAKQAVLAYREGKLSQTGMNLIFDSYEEAVVNLHLAMEDSE